MKFTALAVVVLLALGIVLGAMLVMRRDAQAGPTFVSGAIASDTTWALSGSPFIVTGDIAIAPGVTLTIEPGVEVRFDGFYKVLVRGTLNAIGTDGQPILFTRNSTLNWDRIEVVEQEPAATAIFEHVIIEHAAIGAKGFGVDIRLSTVRNNDLGLEARGQSVVWSNLIADNDTGVLGSGLVASNDIVSNGIGVHGGNVTGNRIVFNVTGVLGGTSAQGNAICNNIGPGLDGGPSAVNSNLIANNGTAGITGAATAHNNNIIGNGTFAYENTTTVSFDATLNWWGTTDSTAIGASIFDFFDDVTKGIVTFEPFLTDTTWALSGSPFIVTGDIGIALSVTLTIEPGVEVRFDGF